MASGNRGEAEPSALGQLFYLSSEFLRLRMETRDYRLHPVLGGISSTRWSAYERFERRHSLLVDRLRDQELASTAIRLMSRGEGEKPLPSPPARYAVDHIAMKNVRLADAGFLVGSRVKNRLVGSRGDDVLMGNGGADLLIGGKGDDLLVGGGGADRFRFRRPDRRGESISRDTVVDFNPSQGDRLELRGGRHYVGMEGFSGEPGEVQAMVWMAGLLPGWEGELHDWMIQGVTLQIDDDGDRRADGVIELPGLDVFQGDWLTF